VRSGRGFVVAFIAQRCNGSRIAGIQRWLLRWEEADQRSVRRRDHRRPARGAVRRPVVNEDGCVSLLDAIERIEDRRVNDRPEPLTGRVGCIRCNERVDEDLVPIQYL
jgi:hypothetical protein